MQLLSAPYIIVLLKIDKVVILSPVTSPICLFVGAELVSPQLISFYLLKVLTLSPLDCKS